MNALKRYLYPAELVRRFLKTLTSATSLSLNVKKITYYLLADLVTYTIII